MQERKGEKIGWIAGWTGGFIWLALLSALWLAQGKMRFATAGTGFVALAVLSIIFLAPWKHPDTKYWKLMWPIYGILRISVFGIVWLEGGPARLGLSGWSLLVCLPLFLPCLTVGRRTWTASGA